MHIAHAGFLLHIYLIHLTHLTYWNSHGNIRPLRTLYMTDTKICNFSIPRWLCCCEAWCSYILIMIENALSIQKFQLRSHWCLGMDMYFHTTVYDRCNYLYMLELKLNRFSQMGRIQYKLYNFIFIGRDMSVQYMMHISNSINIYLLNTNGCKVVTK